MADPTTHRPWKDEDNNLIHWSDPAEPVLPPPTVFYSWAARNVKHPGCYHDTFERAAKRIKSSERGKVHGGYIYELVVENFELEWFMCGRWNNDKGYVEVTHEGEVWERYDPAYFTRSEP